MTAVGEALSGKTERDENFPVASRLVSPRPGPQFSPSIVSCAPPTT